MPEFERIRYFCQDESRFGLKTSVGRLLTLSGVKPLGTWQWQCSLHFGCMEPSNPRQESSFSGSSPMSIAIARERFLNEFSATYAATLNILQVDNGAFHKAKDLLIPRNIILLFQPAYCPELNPIERLWQHLKKDLRWELFKDLTQLQTKVDQLLAQLTAETVASITGYNFILDALSVANLF